jgi:hypothetical protein
VSEHPDEWPTLVYEDLAPTVDYINRLVQVAGKYTLNEVFEPGWGNIVLDITPRGLRTPTLRQRDVTFTVHYRLLDADVVIETNTGSRTLALRTGSVAAFYAAFCNAATELGITRPGSTVIVEIPGAPMGFDGDHVNRSWDHNAAQRIWEAFILATDALKTWQAPYLGYRPPVGVMWGGFDLSATRYRAVPTLPPPDRPAFMQHGMVEEHVSVGFSFGSPESPAPGMYAYIWPQPVGLERRSWGVDGAAWHPDAGLVLLPWTTVRNTPDPRRAVVAFGDAVYDAAVETAGWQPNLVGPRFNGWHMSRTPPALA